MPEFLSGGLATSCFLQTIMTNLPPHISRLSISVVSPLQVRFKAVCEWAGNGTYMGVTWELHGRKKGAVLNEFWGFKRTVMS